MRCSTCNSFTGVCFQEYSDGSGGTSMWGNEPEAAEAEAEANELLEAAEANGSGGDGDTEE